MYAYILVRIARWVAEEEESIEEKGEERIQSLVLDMSSKFPAPKTQ